MRSVKILFFARALLLLDKGPRTKEHWAVSQTSKAVRLSECALNYLKEIFVSQGLDSIIRLRQKQEARVFEEAFEVEALSEPLEGPTRWTVRRLADKLVELEIVE